MKDFSPKTLKALSHKGIRIVGFQAIPVHGDLPWADYGWSWRVDDNGCGRVWTFEQVMRAAAN